MTDITETPKPDDSLKACFIAFDHIMEGVTDMMTFCAAARENGPVEWMEEANKAYQAGKFVALFLGVMQGGLTDLRIATPEVQK